MEPSPELAVFARKIHERAAPKMAPVDEPPAVVRARGIVAQLRSEEPKIGAGRLSLLELGKLLDAKQLAEVLEFASVKAIKDCIDIDINTNIARRRGLTIKLQPAHAAVLYILTKNYPQVASFRDVKIALYGRSEIDNPKRKDTTVRGVITHTRAVAALLGADIINQHGKGWRLELLPLE